MYFYFLLIRLSNSEKLNYGIIITNIIVEPCSSVSTVTRQRAGQPRICGPILVMDKEFFCSPKISHPLWGTSGILFKGQQSVSCLNLREISLLLNSVGLVDTSAMDRPKELNQWQMPVILLIWYDIFVNCNGAVNWVQTYNTHLHTDNTPNNTMKQNTQKGTHNNNKNT